jgi:hypothetical protein
MRLMPGSSGIDSSKYTGSVNYISIASGDTDYWRIPVQGMTVQNGSVSLVRSKPGPYLSTPHRPGSTRHLCV